MVRMPMKPRGPFARAILAYGIALICAPTFARTAQDSDHLRQAFAALQAGDAVSAESSFRAALERNPKDIGAYVGLAQALMRQGKPTEAIETHRKAIELNPLSADLRIGFAATLEAGGKAAEAISELRRAVGLSPANPRVLTLLAGALRRAGMLNAAEDAGLRALGLAPDAAPVHQELAEIAAARADWPLSIRHYEAAIRLQPESRPARLAHLAALNNGERHAEARSVARSMLGAVPDDIDVRMALASALEGLEEREQAIAEYRRVLEKAPNLAIAWGNLGWSQYGAGLLTEAEASSRKALGLDAELAYVRFNLGLILASSGRWDEAVREYEAAIASGDLSDLRAGLADVESALRRRPGDASLIKAKRLLEEALAKTTRR